MVPPPAEYDPDAPTSLVTSSRKSCASWSGVYALVVSMIFRVSVFRSTLPVITASRPLPYHFQVPDIYASSAVRLGARLRGAGAAGGGASSSTGTRAPD